MSVFVSSFRRPATLLCVALLGVFGCSKRGTVLAVVYVPPPGFIATTVDERLAQSIGRRLRAIPGVVRVRSVSAAHEIDFYVVGTAGLDVGALSDAARAAASMPVPDVQTEGKVVSVAFLNAAKPIPSADPSTIIAYSVTVDPQRAAAAGVLVSDIDDAVNKVAPDDRPATADGIPTLLSTPLTPVRGGKPVRLGDVAAVGLVKRPVAVQSDY